MAMDLDDLDVLDDDDFIHQEPVQVQPTEPQSIDDDDDDDLPVGDSDVTPVDDSNEDVVDNALERYLKTKGITDLSKIKFQGEDDVIEELDWNSLSEDEKFNILNTGTDNSELDLDDTEIDLINRIRLSNMSVDDFIKSVKHQAATEAYNEYVKKQQEEYTYTVDDLSDEELYVLDLQARIEDISDEEIQEALDRAKSNETLFAKEIAGLREDYKRLEDERNLREQAIAEQQQKEQFEQFSNGIINGINSFNSIGSLDIDLTDDDKNALYTFITGTDSTGVNYFAKALSDPETVVKTAWFAMHGEDVINSIEDYYKQQITQVAKYNYEKGLNERKQQKVVVTKKSQPKTTKVVKSIHDLD